ncbi:MAG: hypothetical protein AAF806_10390 [Bacteroidota bacterium]
MHQSRENRAVPKFYAKDHIEQLKGRIREAQDFTFFGVTKTRVGEAPLSLAFKVIKQNGEQFIIQYHQLQDPFRFDGNSKIELKTTNVSIQIEGKNLQDLFDYLAEHRVVWMKEPDSEFMEIRENEVEVTNIEITTI